MRRSLDSQDIMQRNFYFGADRTMAQGSAVFSAAINADPSAFGLTEAQAIAYGEIDAALQIALKAANTPSTRTPVAVSLKNDSMKSMQRSAKALADIIRATPSVTDAQLINIGLLPRPVRTRRHVPDDPPRVQVVDVDGRIVSLRVLDGETYGNRRKARGACGALIFSYVGEEPPADPRAYRYECLTSRTTATITFPNDVPSGATVWLSAQWVSARGETSIGSAPLSFTLQGGPVGAATRSMLRAA